MSTYCGLTLVTRWIICSSSYLYLYLSARLPAACPWLDLDAPNTGPITLVWVILGQLKCSFVGYLDLLNKLYADNVSILYLHGSFQPPKSDTTLAWNAQFYNPGQ